MKKLLFIIYLLLIAVPVWATTYTICSSSCTYTTLNDASATAYADADIIELRADTPGGSKSFAAMSTQWPKGGTANYVTIRGRAGDTITISGAGQDYAFDKAITLNYLKLQNLILSGGTNAALGLRAGDHIYLDTVTTTGSQHGIYIIGAVTNLTAVKWTSYSNTADGGFFNAAVTGTITDPNVYNNGAYGVAGNLGGITWSGTTMSGSTSSCNFSGNVAHGWCNDVSSDYAVVQYCVSKDNCSDTPTCGAGNRRHGFVFANGATNFTIANSYGDGDLGIDVQATSGSNMGTVTGNIFVGRGTGQGTYGTGILIGALSAPYNDLVNIYNNTSISLHASGAALYTEQYVNTLSTVKNNIFYNMAGGAAYLVDTGASYITTDYNVYYTSASNIFSDKGTGRTFAAWKSASSQDAHSVVQDPNIQSTYRASAYTPFGGTCGAWIPYVDMDGKTMACRTKNDVILGATKGDANFTVYAPWRK
jgi:hypothetical protein